MSVEQFNKLTKKRNKYNAQKTEYEGRVFDSKREADFAKRLNWLRHAKQESDRVTRIEYQVPLAVVVRNTHICKYICDFKVYYADNHTEYIDVKGMKTAVYKLKKRLVEAQHQIIIKEV